MKDIPCFPRLWKTEWEQEKRSTEKNQQRTLIKEQKNTKKPPKKGN